MAKLLKLRRGTTSQHSSFTGAEGEVTVDTDKETLVDHNGSSAAGFPLARESALTSKADLASPDFTTDITLKAQAPVKFEDDSGGEYVGLKAPTGVTSYTVTLPATAPSNGQVLKATSATALGWSADTALTLIDEDDFSSDSATAVPSQQSTKAYIAATSQPLDADLTALAGCQTGSAAALALLTSTEVAALDGFTGDKDDLIYAKDLKATGVTATEFDYLDGVTSAIQTQINAKGTSNVALSGDNTWSGSQRGSVSTLTYGATVAIDMDTTNNHIVTLTGNIRFNNPTNCDADAVGQSGSIFIVQDGTGSRTAAWGTDGGTSSFHWKGGTAPTLSTAANAVDRVDYIVYAADKIHCVATIGISANT